jgi:hypothetical protein
MKVSSNQQKEHQMKQATMPLRLPTAVILMAGFGAISAFGQFAATGTTNLSVTVGAEAAIQVNTATTNLTSAGLFADYTGTTSLTYKIRTTQSGGTGSVVLKITTDFAAGGPSVAAPAAGDALTYTCTVAAPGTACTGSVTALTSATTSVATFAADAHSAKAGNAASVAWDLPDDPVYKTGSYTAVATFTISAT